MTDHTATSQETNLVHAHPGPQHVSRRRLRRDRARRRSVFAIAEERLNRHKHFGGFPALAVKACLDAVGAKISDVDHVAVGQDSDANLAKKVQYALANPAKILNFIRLRQRKEAMRDVRSLLAKALDVDPRNSVFRSTISSTTSPTSPAPTTVRPGKKRRASATTVPAISSPP
jgi:hypothetical protein